MTKKLVSEKNIRLKAIFPLFLALLIVSIPVSGQTKRITLTMSNAKISDVIDKIEEQTSYHFYYSDNQVDVSKSVSFNFKNETIEAALKQVFGDTDISYRVQGNDIFLTPKAEKQARKLITGVITDERGETIIGASVFQRGTNNGTITDLDGKFSLEVEAGTVLEISYIGYLSQSRTVGANSVYNVILKEDTQQLDEVVVIGYGVQKKSDLTGAISSVKASELPQSASTSIESMLSGKVAGMQITATDAQPGGGLNISIRGQGSVNASNEPLYVIDGFPVSGGLDPKNGDQYKNSENGRSPLNTINPNDIESIEVLKDASATAIYGARAANGVILITTKSGKLGKPVVSYDTKFGVQKMSNEFEMMTLGRWYQVRNQYDREVWLQDNNFYPYGSAQPTGNPTLSYTDTQIANAGRGTDWVDEVTRTGMAMEHNFSISGATEAVNYLASINYYDQSGVVKNNNFTRYSARLNLSTDINKWLKVGLNATGSRVKFRNPTLGTGSSEASGLLESARVFSPDLPIRDDEGNFTLMPGAETYPNPVSLLDIDNRTTQDRILAQAFAEVMPVKDLRIRLQLGADRQNAVSRLYLPKSTLYGGKVNGLGYINQQNKLDKLMTLTANYTRTFNGIHRFTGLVGYEWQILGEDGHGMESSNFASDGSMTNSMGDGKNRPKISSYKTSTQFASYFGRINYSLADKYIFTFSLRADGSDKFGEDNRWGYFPSGAMAWRVDQEKFMENIDWISNAKLRMSLGQTGNSNISGSAYGYYSFAGDRDYLFGGIPHAGAYQESFPNASLKWETTTEFNLGVDLSFLNNRINVTAEYFSKKISDLLMARKINYYLPGDDIFANIGKTTSKGFDLNIHTINLDKELFWSTTLNLSAYRDRWKKRNPEVALTPYQSQKDNLRVYWGYILDGIVQPGEELAYGNYPAGSQKVKDIAGVDENGNKIMGPDGIINEYDMVKLANQDPDLIFGFTNTFRYKSFDLNIHAYGFLGWKKYNSWQTSVKDMNNKIEAGYNYANVNFGKFWSSDNLNGKYPSMYANKGEPGSTQYGLEKADFLRVRNITLGYTLSDLQGVRQWFKQARFYVDVANPFIITKFTQIDPEYSGTYPVSRTYTIGVNLQF